MENNNKTQDAENPQESDTFGEWYARALDEISPEDYRHVLEHLPECLTDMNHTLPVYKDYGKRALKLWGCLAYMRERIIEEAGKLSINHLAKTVNDQKNKTGLFAYGVKVHVPKHYAPFLNPEEIEVHGKKQKEKTAEQESTAPPKEVVAEVHEKIRELINNPKEEYKSFRLALGQGAGKGLSYSYRLNGSDKRTETSVINGKKGGRPRDSQPSHEALLKRARRSKKTDKPKPN